MKKPANWYCARFKKVLTTYSDVQNRLVRTRCKMWDCRYCANINRKRWRAVLLSYFNSEEGRTKVWSFNTITIPRYIHRHSMVQARIELSLAFIRTNWDRLIKRLKREYGNFSYVRVLEQHQSGVLHIHLLASFHLTDLHTGYGKRGKAYSYSPKFKSHVTACGFGFISNSQNILDEHGEPANAGYVAGYPLKYMTKQSESFATAMRGRRCRRVLTSRDIGSPQVQESSDIWWLRDGIYFEEVLSAQLLGIQWIDLNTGAIITTDDFDDSDRYPSLLE